MITTTALMAEKQNHELEAFINQHDHLKDCINPSDLASKCYSKKIIGSEEFEEIEDEKSRPKKATILLRVVGRSIKSDPANFYTFLRVLGSESTNKKLVEDLDGEVKVRKLAQAPSPPEGKVGNAVTEKQPLKN